MRGVRDTAVRGVRVLLKFYAKNEAREDFVKKAYVGMRLIVEEATRRTGRGAGELRFAYCVLAATMREMEAVQLNAEELTAYGLWAGLTDEVLRQMMADLNEDVSSFSRCPSYVEAKQLKGICHEFLSLTETEQDGEAISKRYLSWAEAATLHNQVWRG